MTHLCSETSTGSTFRRPRHARAGALALLAGLALADCAGPNLSLTQAEPPPPATAAAPEPPVAAAPVAAPPVQPARPGRSRTPVRTAAADPEPMTIQLARSQCWMALETDRRAPKDLTERAKRVELCAEKKLEAAQ